MNIPERDIAPFRLAGRPVDANVRADVVQASSGTEETITHLQALVDASPIAMLIFDAEQRVHYANRTARIFARILNPESHNRDIAYVSDIHADLLSPTAMHLCSVRGSWVGEVTIRSSPQQEKVFLVQISALGPNRSYPYGLSVRDITIDYTRAVELQERNVELEVAYAKLQGVREQVIQSEKLASIGQLAAGVAHEINNPIGYVNSNLNTLQQYVSRLLSAVQTYAAVLARVGDAATTAEVEDVRKRLDLDYLVVDVPELLSESREGIDRVCKIVRDLKNFSRREQDEEWVEADIHKGLESTLNIVWNELKYKADVVRNFGELPMIECLPSALSQVFMNILLNAGHAIKDHGVITVSTGRQDDKVWIAIGDDGEGIEPDVLPRIFDPFFTTKPIGTGTGLGLAISYGIVKKHGGNIEVTSVPGQGALFRIELPIRQQH